MGTLFFVLVIVFVTLFVWCYTRTPDPFRSEIDQLEEQINNSSLVHMSEEELEKLKNDVIAIAHRGENDLREHYTPQSYPYNMKQKAVLPNDLFSRLIYLYPGFELSGWSYWTRPGTYKGQWPRSRWVANNYHYYLINNLTEIPQNCSSNSNDKNAKADNEKSSKAKPSPKT